MLKRVKRERKESSGGEGGEKNLNIKIYCVLADILDIAWDVILLTVYILKNLFLWVQNRCSLIMEHALLPN